MTSKALWKLNLFCSKKGEMEISDLDPDLEKIYTVSAKIILYILTVRRVNQNF